MIDFTPSTPDNSRKNPQPPTDMSSRNIENSPNRQESNTFNSSPVISPNSPPQQKSRSDNDNIVFVGSKHLMNYVNSIDIQLKSSPEVIIKARGKFISKAVDIVEVAKRQEHTNMTVKDIRIGTEEYENEGKKVKVSTVDIIVGK